jgi:GntR family transcriptional regulator, rspAB operon transcriptional repressor
MQASAEGIDRNVVTRRAPVSLQIERAIREQILAVELAPGAAISENEFAGQFGVSRTPVREAFLALAKDGLIDIFPQHGSFIARIALKRVEQAQFVRLTLETAALARAGSAAARQMAPRLQRLLAEAQAALAAGDMRAFYRLDDAFHAALSEGSGRPLVVEVCRFVGSDIARIRHLRLPHAEYTAAILEEHRSIAVALARGDVRGAVAVLREHLQYTFMDIGHVRRDHPDYVTDAA